VPKENWMKIGMGGFRIESCTFSPLLAREKDFQVLRGKRLLENYPFRSKYNDVEFVPLVNAGALPGGPVERSFYDSVKDEFLRGLREQGPWDGLFLHMHGAVNVAGLDDAEGDLLAAIREAVGPASLIAASYDLHGNVSRRVMDCLDILSAYRTAPHVDGPETLERACALLVRCIEGKIRPHKAFVPVPILLPGEKTSTEWEPAASLYRLIPGVIKGDVVLDASILIGYVWADELRSTAAVIALGTDGEKVHNAAVMLAQFFWDVRHEFRFGVTADSVDRCIQMALDAPERPVVISDSGDNPTAGGVGDVPYVLERMQALGVTDGVFASITDPEAVATCEAAGSGADVEFLLGGKLDPIHGKPLRVKGHIVSLYRQPWLLSRTGDTDVVNRMAVVDVQGIQVIVTERRTVFHRMADFRNLGIEPGQHKIVVVKIGYLEPELKSLAAKALLALSPGAVNQDITSLPFKRIQRPMYPFDPGMVWCPEVQSKNGERLLAQ
jgi:microcystin degradation protein MlrC